MTSAPILITGVSRRLGLHMASTFLRRGIPIIGTYRTQRPSLDELAQLGAELHQVDFQDNSQIERFIAAIRETHKSLRAIIHNASDWQAEPTRSDGDADLDAIMQRMMRVHVHAPYLINLSLSPLLENNSPGLGSGLGPGLGDIIHIGDYVSSQGSQKHIAYAASKAAQDNLTLSFAAKLAPTVKVNSIAPALIIFQDGDDDNYKQKAKQKSLMQKEGGLDEFQNSIDFVLNSQYLTGRILPLDGGRHLR